MTVRRSGFTLIELMVVSAIIAVLASLALVSVQAARSSSQRVQCVSNLRQLGIALNAYESALQHFPAGAISRAREGDPTTPHSFYRWSVLAQLTPYLEQRGAFESLDMTLPLYGRDFQVVPANRAGVALLIPEFLCPSDEGQRVNPLFGPTNYAANAGTGANGGSPFDADGVFYINSNTRTSDVRDGLSKTAAMSESILGRPIATTTPREQADPRFVYVFAKSTPLTEESCRASAFWNYADPRGFSWANGEFRGALYNHYLPPNSLEIDCLSARTLGPPSVLYAAYGWRTARSFHTGGVNMSMLDASVRFVADDTDTKTWRAISSRAD